VGIARVVTGSLFDESGGFDRERLAGSLAALAQRKVLVGGSSWKYDGWLGQVYTRERYTTRGRFSKKQFEAECLREYAETFPTVCGDFAFYRFPEEAFWRRLFSQVPPGFQFGFKVPELITCKVFPTHERYGLLGGRENEAFLNAHALREMFLRPLQPYRAQTGVLIFEFGTFSRQAFPDLTEFVERLDLFLRGLPREFRYAVEVRNPELLRPDYFECLRGHNVAHVYNAWSRMPELGRQVAIAGSRTADFMVCRGLLRHGRMYEQAVEKFAPYTQIQDPNPEARQAMREMIAQAQNEDQFFFLFVNNRLEGNAPMTIVSLVEP
jgi:uncharacterized protein YecE (DUF72 family)